MDGIRAYWDGQRLTSRQGSEINAPEEFTRELPKKVPLDGELWMGRGTLERLFNILHSNEGDWSMVQYRVFDLPGSSKQFSDRVEELKQIPFPSHVVPQRQHLTLARCMLYPIQYVEEMNT